MDPSVTYLMILCGTVISSWASTLPGTRTRWLTLDGKPTVFMGHRGEKVLMPEHTLGSYEFAAIEGAEYVEPDLVLTKDGFLVCYHDLNLKDGTNVESLPQFAHLKRNFTETLGYKNVTILDDWFIGDFTFNELSELRVKQRTVGIRPQYFNDNFQIPSFEEYLDVVLNVSTKLNRSIGIVPELKHPSYHNKQHSLNGPNYMEDKFLTTLRLYGYPTTGEVSPGCGIPALKLNGKTNNSVKCGHVIVQSFEKDSLQYLAKLTKIDLLMLVDDDFYFLTYEGLDEIAKFARYYSVWKKYLYKGTDNETVEYPKDVRLKSRMIPSDRFVEEAHKRNMRMGIYTVYDSREDPNKAEEMKHLFSMGVDFMFVENINEARQLRQSYDCEVDPLNSVSAAQNSRISVWTVAVTPIFLLVAMNNL